MLSFVSEALLPKSFPHSLHSDLPLGFTVTYMKRTPRNDPVQPSDQRLHQIYLMAFLTGVFPSYSWGYRITDIPQFPQLIYFTALLSLSLERFVRICQKYIDVFHVVREKSLFASIWWHDSEFSCPRSYLAVYFKIPFLKSSFCFCLHNSSSLEMYFQIYLSRQILRLVLSSLIWS